MQWSKQTSKIIEVILFKLRIVYLCPPTLISGIQLALLCVLENGNVATSPLQVQSRTMKENDTNAGDAMRAVCEQSDQ